MLATKNPARLGHLEMLESESIEIFRPSEIGKMNDVVSYFCIP